MVRYKYINLIIIAFASLSCSTPEVVTDINLSLKDALIESSEGEGLNYYILPESNDFASIPQDKENWLSSEKVELGKLLFHETGLATNPIQTEGLLTFSCASCHHAQAGFQAGTRQSIGDGGVGFGNSGESRSKSDFYSSFEPDAPSIRSPSILNIAYQTNVLWNGQFGASGVNEGTEEMWTLNTPKEDNFLGFEGVETQAISSIELHRMEPEISLCNSNSQYLSMFQESFPNEPITDITVGLALAAYERTVLANEAPFQQWLKGDYSAMSEEEKEGAILFFTKGKCFECHTGPALNSMSFYALGMKDLEGPTVLGIDVNDNAKNGRGGFTKKDADLYKFKVPQLYNLKDSPFYGHGGSFTDIRSVIRYKNIAKSENANVNSARFPEEFKPLDLSEEEIDKITLFIAESLYDPNLIRYVPDFLPSGLCFPNNDEMSQLDLDCN